VHLSPVSGNETETIDPSLAALAQDDSCSRPPSAPALAAPPLSNNNVQRHLGFVGPDAAWSGIGHARSEVPHRQPDDARSRVSQKGLRRAEASTRKRAAHVY